MLEALAGTEKEHVVKDMRCRFRLGCQLVLCCISKEMTKRRYVFQLASDEASGIASKMRVFEGPNTDKSEQAAGGRWTGASGSSKSWTSGW